MLTPETPQSTSHRGESVSWCVYVRCTCGACRPVICI